MNTFAIQLLLHYQTPSAKESKFDSFLADLRALAEQHGITFDDFQSFGLSGSDFRIEPCAKCGYLTVDQADVTDGIESVLPDFWFYVRRGGDSGNGLTCDLCGPTPIRAQPSIPADA